MHRQTVFVVLFVIQCCDWTETIKVPIDWDYGDNSKVQESDTSENQESLVETLPPHKQPQKEIPVEYFQYTANKPQFAVELAAFHGVKSPQSHYKSYPVRPYTGLNKPKLGKHHMLDTKQEIYKPYQQYKQENEDARSFVTPTSAEYQVYHPYKEEEPALQEIYKDPVLDKIRNDIRNSKNRLQNYENEAGKPNISKGEYLESPEETDHKLFPHKNNPAPFEIYRPNRRPIYYRASPFSNNRHVVLNKKFAHPWNQNHKIRPIHYRPLQNQLQRLRQQHSIQYHDDQNEYPELTPAQNYAEVPDGYDIFEKGKQKYYDLRNNVDGSLNKAVLENKPVTYQQLEMQNDDASTEEEEFVPIKNYAQVRKTETTRHLPKSAAYQDADSIEEIRNAPRLKEAVKSTKAQTVYSEEGYEDAAYDHAGEQKHASDHEGHGGVLKENEISGGQFKTPSFSGSYEDAKGSEYRDQTLHGEKWKNKNKDSNAENDSQDYADDETEESEDLDIYDENDNSSDKEEEEKPSNERIKRENNIDFQLINKTVSNAPIPVPEIKFKSSFFEVKNNSKLLNRDNKKESLQSKYPYYFKNLRHLHQDSPLRYSENLKLIPRKSSGGSEFYESRSEFECPEVEENVNPIPLNLANKDKTEDGSSEEVKVGLLKKQERLYGLGDKIDCFKAKFFGSNPLDSPFFKESIIKNPEPLFNFDPEFTSANLQKLKKLIHIEPFPTIRIIQNDTNNVSEIHSSPIDQSEKSENITKTPLIIEKSGHTLLNTSNVNTIRSKRATGFVYEPYKIIKDVPITDSKKTTTLSNVSPLIKQLQSSKIIDTVIYNPGKDQPVKRNVITRKYKEIKKQDRQKETQSKEEDSDIVDVSIDKRRGEPRYEVRHSNHKKEYVPVANKVAMTAEDYKAQTSANRTRPSKIVTLENDLPKSVDRKYEAIDRDPYDNSPEYNDDESDNVSEEITTQKPIFRKKIRFSTTTAEPENEDLEVPKLRLITRFNKPKKDKENEASIIHQSSQETPEKSPQYREKKKKSTKSTLVTDSKSYGEDNDDMKKEEIDALIRVKQDMSEFTPQYEKDLENQSSDNQNSDEDYEDYSGEDESSEDEESEEDAENEDEDNEQDEYKVTTSEPIKRSLIMTTDAPVSTTEAKTAKLQIKPVVVRKKIEIHQETPVNKSAPYRSQYKQDIKEIEVIKEMPRILPRRKPNKNVEVLDLYKDDNLAKHVNKLGDVEVFKENINIKEGPRHGGNYRNAKIVELSENLEPRMIHGGNYKRRKINNKDTETYQSNNEKFQHSGPRKSHSGISKSNYDLRSSGENYEDSDSIVTSSDRKIKQSESDEPENTTESIKSVKPKLRIRLRNKSAKVSRNTDKDELTEISENNASSEDSSGKQAVKKAAVLLNSFAQAATVLTTTPAYILDPSKRMYYYVEK